MAKGGSGGVVKHPIVTDIDAFGAGLNKAKAVEWLKNNHSKPLSDKEAADIIQTAKDYSDTHSVYTGMHMDTMPEKNAKVDKMIEDPKAPVYGKTQYRGIHVTDSALNKMGLSGMTPKEYIESILKTGTWKEPGVTSFSATKNTAMGFANYGSSKGISVIVTYHNPTTGMPFKHISNISSENEVLHSSKQMKNGYQITGYHVSDNGKTYWIEVADGKGHPQKLEDLITPSF